MEQWRLATISFKLWGALSPTKEFSIEEHKKTDSDNLQTDRPPTPKRSIGQAEIESSYFKVVSHLRCMV